MTESKVADVALILEGTYPFVPGGVSSWVHQLVTAMPELTFALHHISPRPGYYDAGHAYEVPPNVIAIDQVFLQRPVHCFAGEPGKKARAGMVAFSEAIAALRRGEIGRVLQLATHLSVAGDLPFSSLDVLASPEQWDVLQRIYRREAPDVSFLDYYWNWVFAHQPMLNLLTSPLPRARALHTISTGYAGMLAAFASVRLGVPMILTEHGIYTKERRIEIHAADWVPAGPDEVVPDIRAPYFQGFWNRQFRMMSRLCYDTATRIYTLYAGNRTEQVADGAAAEKISIVPNGIDANRFAAAAERFEQRKTAAGDRPFTVGFVGRVCPIKDVRTFIAAMRLVADKVPNFDARIMGPTDEDKDYVEQCRAFLEGLGLQDKVRFMGRVALTEELDQLDVMVLTSISEAQPLVILEAGAVGIPVVASDVGSCQEMIVGRTAADRSLGRGGIVTPIAAPGATARAILELYDDPELRYRMGQNLKRRVIEYFDHVEMIDTYRGIYNDLIALELV